MSILSTQPQLIWRGTDFGYLPTLRRPKHSAPLGNYLEDLVKECISSQEGEENKMIEATKALREKYDLLPPRWKGAVLTAVSG